MDVTVIIPIHNSEKYLRECIQSAQLQSLRDIEILCIDDNSVDSSYEIICELQKKDNRIFYVKDSGTGYGHKLNIGIKLAKGKYIAILESDDKMELDMLKQLYSIAVKYNVDVVDSDYYEVFTNNNREFHYIKRKYDVPDIYDCLLDNSNNKCIATNGIWTALYKKEFLVGQGIKLNESPGASYQDMSFLFLTSLLAKSVYHLSVPFYCYRIDNMYSSVKDNNKIFEIVDECEFLKRELNSRSIGDEIWKLYYIRKYKAFYWNYRRLSAKARAVFLEKYKEELIIDMENKCILGDIFEGALYNRTILLVDNQAAFIDIVTSDDKKQPIARICDFFPKMEGKEIVVFGIGVLGRQIIDIIMQNENIIVKGICDNSKELQGSLVSGYKVSSVEEMVSSFPDLIYLIVNRKDSEKMKNQLLKNRIEEEKMLIFR